MTVEIVAGDCRESIKLIADNSIDSCVCDPPYSLVSIQKRFGKPGQAPAQYGKDGLYQRASAGFMGAGWDTGEVVHDPVFWTEVLRVLKPGAHLVAFGGTRTYHRMACAIEDAGFEIRDTLAWVFGSGFPKSHDIAKAIDKAAGAERRVVLKRTINNNRFAVSGTGDNQEQYRKFDNNANITAPATDAARFWSGWGTALKPAFEPIVLARKPLIGTVVQNVLTHGTGALNIDGCRIDAEGRPLRIIDPKPEANGVVYSGRREAGHGFDGGSKAVGSTDLGRWPANLIHDGSDEVIAAFPDSAGQQGDLTGHDKPRESPNGVFGKMAPAADHVAREDSGSAARFFYCAKAGKQDRWGSKHPTVKPVELMRHLCRLVTPPGGCTFDPFAGSGTTGVAAIAEGMSAILCEREASYLADIRERIAFYQGEAAHSLASKGRKIAVETAAGMDLPLFDPIFSAQLESRANEHALAHQPDPPPPAGA